jgi:energy-coupling factor transporter ATP-binding protein EcfA2
MPDASQAARWQAYQTRARMSMHLWYQIITALIFFWLFITFYVVWWTTGLYYPAIRQWHHPYFLRWVLGGIFTRTPLLNSYAARMKFPIARGQPWYPIIPLTDWLNGPQFYHAPFTAWFWHYGKLTILIPVMLAIPIIAWRRKHRRDHDHVRGLRLLAPHDHNRQLNGGWFQMIRKGHEGIHLGQSIIPAAKECEHFLITGSPGAGKSTLIRHMLGQIQDREQSAVVIDPDCEFVQEFYDEARGDVVLNPLDARCPFWSPWLEFRPESFEMDAEAMAASLIRSREGTPTDKFFQESARTLIESIFKRIKDRDTHAFIDFLSQPRPLLHKKLEGTDAYALIDPEAHDQGSGIVAVAANATKSFHHLPKLSDANREWSAREWATTRKGWVFLSSSEDARAAIQTLQGVWLDTLVRWLMSNEIGSNQVWIMADEMPALGYQPQIKMFITRGRKRGLAVVMGFQNISQLRAIYGDDDAITLTSSPTTKVILRCDEEGTAEWASKMLGSRELIETSMTQVAGVSAMREGINLQNQKREERIVSPAQIQLLQSLHGYLCVAGQDRTTLAIPERHLVKRCPAFISRATTPPQDEDKTPDKEWSL